MTKTESVTMPKWMLALVGSVMALLFGALLSWLTSLNVAIHKNAVDIMAVKTQLVYNTKMADEIKEDLKVLDTKLDRIIENTNNK